MADFLRTIKEKIRSKGIAFLLTITVSLTGFFIFYSYAANIKTKVDCPRVSLTKKGFIKEGMPFKFVGANAVNMVFYDDWGLDVEKAIRTAKENNISVLRLYIDLGWGKDDDFDRIFDIASKNGIYIILAFTDCCCSGDYESLKKYFEVHAPFCNITNKESVRAFKRLIKQIIERKNSVNARLYRQDPTILAWEVANELEYWRFSQSEVRAWIDEIAGYIKDLDKNHLVTIGLSTRDLESVSSDDLLRTFGSAAVDFYSFHFYPLLKEDSYSEETLVENSQRVGLITKKFLFLGKPVVMSEFGFSNSKSLNEKTRKDREGEDFYVKAIKEYADAAFYNGCSGVMLWGWGLSEAKHVPMWWSDEDHSTADKKLCNFLKKYQIPLSNER